MTITLSPQTETLLKEQAEHLGQDADTLADELLQSALEGVARDFEESCAAIAEGFTDIEAGRTVLWRRRGRSGKLRRPPVAPRQIVEQPDAAMASPGAVDIGDVREVINRGPFGRFSRLDYVGYARDTAFYQVHKALWRRLVEPDVRAHVEALCRASLKRYYQRASLAAVENRF